MASIRFRFSPDDRKLAEIARALQAKRSAPFDRMYQRWGTLYSGMIRRRFQTLSHGGSWEGQVWAPLKLATVRGRRLGGSGGKRPGGGKSLTRGEKLTRIVARLARSKNPEAAARLVKQARRIATAKVGILQDTGIMFGALSIGAEGNLLERIPDGIRFGFSGAPHGTKGRVTIRQLAEIHSSGNRSRGLPARPILARPNPDTAERMLIELRAAIVEVIRSI